MRKRVCWLENTWLPFQIGTFLRLAVLALGVSGLAVNAATYYVRKDGNNSNTGTADSAAGAWATIQKAATTMVAGDTVIVADGNYPETVTTGASGTSGSRITYLARSTNAVVTSFTVNKPYQTINGFTITGDSASIDGSVLVTTGGNELIVCSNVFQSSHINVAQLYVYVYGVNVQKVTAYKNKFLDAWFHSIVLTSGGGHIISNNTMSAQHGFDLFRIACTNVTIVGNTITNWSNAEVTGPPLKVGVTYYFKDVSGSPDFSNVGAGPPPYTVGEGSPWKATGTTPLSFGNAKVEVSNHPDIIQAFQNGAVGTIPPDRPSWDLVFERNLVTDCTGGVQLGNITDDGNFGNIKRWTFRNNVFVRISNTLNLFAPFFDFHNNTFYQCAGNSGFVVIWNVSGTAGKAHDLTFYNNIVAECGNPTQANQGWYGGDAAPNQFKDYNLVVGRGTGTVKSGFNEPHSLNGVNPLFVNAAANDFRLQASSPAIGAGMSLNSKFTTDFNGVTRGSSWDMGAYQFRSQPATPPVSPGNWSVSPSP